jgi:2-hydroxy-3-keto-5-methylthiopentenyl-1-phosphate phosphatase
MDRVILCDFDGTITVEETFVAVLKHFAPELSAQLLPEMYHRRLTLRQGVRQILESIPSSRYTEILEFTRYREIRPGFTELLDFLESQAVPLVVVSGGLRGMVEVVLGSLVKRVRAIHAVDVDLSNSHLRVISEFEGESDLMDKVQVMLQYSSSGAIAIGDSLTDLNLALAAPVVFARVSEAIPQEARLAYYLEQRQKSYIPWNDFFEIRSHLTQMWS